MQNLQQQLDRRNDEYGRLMHLFGALRSGTDVDATTLLARLRLGESIDDLVAAVGVPVDSPSTYVLLLKHAASSRIDRQSRKSQMAHHLRTIACKTICVLTRTIYRQATRVGLKVPKKFCPLGRGVLVARQAGATCLNHQSLSTEGRVQLQALRFSIQASDLRNSAIQPGCAIASHLKSLSIVSTTQLLQ